MNALYKLMMIAVLLLNLNGLMAQEIYAGRYKAIFNEPPQKVPTAKTPDGPLAGNGDIGLTMGGTTDQIRFFIGKNDFWRAYPVYPGGGIAFPGSLEFDMPALKGVHLIAHHPRFHFLCRATLGQSGY